MQFTTPKKILDNYIKDKKLKHSEKRFQILEVFLKSEKHLTADELSRMVKKVNSKIGIATIYRTLALLCESGLCRELKFDDGISRYEHLYGHEHHDHLICTECGQLIEIISPEIEKLQEEIAKKENFLIKKHKLEIYGICKKCQTKDKKL